MADPYSFRDYILKRFDTQLHETVGAYIASDYAGFYASAHGLSVPVVASLSDMSVGSIKIGAQYDLEVAFDILLSAKISLSYDGAPASPLSDTAMLQLLCQADLACGMDDFTVTDILMRTEDSVIYSLLLSDTLVPIIRRDDLERTAHSFLRRYCPEALESPMPVDPYIIANRMGLTVTERPLSPDGSVFGQIYFYDADDDTKAGTIYVDPKAVYEHRGGNIATSVIHECVHWELHRKPFAFERLCRSGVMKMSCTSENGIVGDATNDISLMEWQANALASRIQMPLGRFKQQAEATIARLRQETGKTDLLDIIEPVIDELARFFRVSRLASKIRMVEAGYEEAIGAYIYIDGRYVAPHMVRREHVRPNQTYCISLRDAVRLSVTDTDFKEVTASGLFSYVDAHFILHYPEYVHIDDAGRPHLTDHARRHMEECCLLFALSFDVATYDDDQFAHYYLNRDGSTEIVPTYTPVFATQKLEKNNTYKRSSTNLTDDDRDKLFSEYQEELDVLRELPNDFLSALGKIIAWRKATNNYLVDATGLDKADVSRYLSGKKDMPPIALAKILLALHSPPQINDYLLRLAPKQFNLRVEEHQRYRFLLQYGTKYKYDDAMELFLNQ